MTDPRYRLSDVDKATGYRFLQYFCDKEGRFVPMMCDDYDHYCGTICKMFATDGESAVIKCQRPEIYLELEI